MNEIVTDLKRLELETLKNLKSSKAPNTLRAYQADFKDFSLFCLKNGLTIGSIILHGLHHDAVNLITILG